MENLTQVDISTVEDAQELLLKGDSAKMQAETKLNDKSSRSHCIFKLNLQIEKRSREEVGSTGEKSENIKVKKLSSCLNLIDLAGSENVNKAKTDGIRMKEGANINKSLLSLSSVIHKLSSQQKGYINYRDSKLTRLLQPSLSGNSKTMIICTVTESKKSYYETWNTLNFGSRAKCIKTNITVNEIDENHKIAKENNLLKSRIKELEKIVEKSNNKNIKSKAMETEDDEKIMALYKEFNELKSILFNSKSQENLPVGNSVQSVPQGRRSNSINMNSFESLKGMDIDQTGHITNNFELDPTPMSPGRHVPGNSNPYYSRLLMSNYNTSYQDHHYGSYYKCLSDAKFINPNFHHVRKMPDEMENPSKAIYLERQNQELKHNMIELQSSLQQTIHSKDIQIQKLTKNLNYTLDNCDRIIRDAENSMLRLHSDKELLTNQLETKDSECQDLRLQIRTLETSLSLSKEREHMLEDSSSGSYARNYDKLTKDHKELQERTEAVENELAEKSALLDSRQKELELLKGENSKLKSQVENLQNEKASMQYEQTSSIKSLEKYSKENQSLKNDIESYKNELVMQKDKYMKLKQEMKSSLKQNKENTTKVLSSKFNKITKSFSDKENLVPESKPTSQSEALKEKISRLESELENKKAHSEELQRLIDEVFEKMGEMQQEIEEKDFILQKFMEGDEEYLKVLQSGSSGTLETKSSNGSTQSNKTKENRLQVKEETPKPAIVTSTGVSDFSFKDPSSYSNSKNNYSSDYRKVSQTTNTHEICVTDDGLDYSKSEDILLGKKRKKGDHVDLVYRRMIDYKNSKKGALVCNDFKTFSAMVRKIKPSSLTSTIGLKENK